MTGSVVHQCFAWLFGLSFRSLPGQQHCYRCAETSWIWSGACTCRTTNWKVSFLEHHFPCSWEAGAQKTCKGLNNALCQQHNVENKFLGLIGSWFNPFLIKCLCITKYTVQWWSCHHSSLLISSCMAASAAAIKPCAASSMVQIGCWWVLLLEGWPIWLDWSQDG